MYKNLNMSMCTLFRHEESVTSVVVDDRLVANHCRNYTCEPSIA